MRVGLLSQWFPPEPGPPSIPAVLGRELVNRGHSVRVLTGFPNYPTGELYPGYRMRLRADTHEEGLPTRRVALFPSHDGSAVGRVLNYGSFAVSASLAGVSSMRGADALWVYNSPPTVGLPTWLIKSRYRPRVVVHVMDMWPESLMATGFGRVLAGRPALARALDHWLEFTYSTADALACTSRRQMDLLASRGVPADKVSYVPVWPDEDVFHPAERDPVLAAELGVTDKFVCLYAGTMGDAQGLDSLIEVCAAFADEPRFHCLMAGAGVAESRLKQRADDLALRNITFLGRRPSHEMTALMALGDVHYVSLRNDPLAAIAMPSKIQATLACSRPLVVAAEGEAADTVRHAGAGWVAAPADVGSIADALRSAMTMPAAELDGLGASGRRYFEDHFSVRTGVDRVETLLSGGPNAA